MIPESVSGRYREREKAAMYKYLLDQNVHTAADVRAAGKQLGRDLPEGINPVKHFVVRLWRWDRGDRDYSIEVLDPPGRQVFAEYDDALDCFRALDAEYAQQCTEETRLQLIQYNRGQVHILHSKILFPALLASEP